MQHRAKLTLVALVAVMTAGCASNNVKQAADDFANGAVSNAEHRQQHPGQHGNADNRLKKEDSIAGIFNIGLQSIVRLFKPTEEQK
ncbi:hypothetical protein [Arsukibacterium perlucidum]|uniref:hypothetical protein n=1 Tax=Arsukibacterium perlucidum TaxID=368811 RepID=UPI0003646E75|nr:hypothetical protein [Arsukibacterium perlucidum]